VTEVTYDTGQSASHSECTVLTVTTSVGSDPHGHVTEVTYDVGRSGSDSKFTVRYLTNSMEQSPS
jgi:hypothetical protein